MFLTSNHEFGKTFFVCFFFFLTEMKNQTEGLIA